MIDIAYCLFYTIFLSIVLLTLNKKPWGSSYNLVVYRLQLRYILLLALFFLMGTFKVIIPGTDSFNYYIMYRGLVEQNTIHPYLMESEIGYRYLNIIFSFFNAPYYVFFGFLTCLTWGLYLISGIKFKQLMPWMIFFTICSGYLLWSYNGVRQIIAVMLFAISVTYIYEKKIAKYVFCIASATIFHQSSLALMPLYFVNRFSFNRNLWLIIYSLSILGIWFGANSRLDLLENFLNILLNSTSMLEKYNQYLGSDVFTYDVGQDSNTGLGIILRIITGYYILFNSSKVLSKFPSLNVYFVLYFSGLILSNLFLSVEGVGRLIQYTNILLGILLAATVYVSENSQEKLISTLVMLAYFTLFLVTIIKTISNDLIWLF